MPPVIPERMTARVDGDFVVFLIGWPAWVAFNRRMAQSRGDVGIWHETYQVRAGEYEAVYGGMPPHGLGKFGALLPATGARDSARERLGGKGAA